MRATIAGGVVKGCDVVELIMVRHALPVRRELLSGAADPEVSEAGRAQAELLGDYLATEELQAIYASPMLRARQTASPLALRVGLDVTIIDGVAEFDQHASEYIPVEELRATNDPRWQQMVNGDWLDGPESRDAFITRVIESLDALVRTHPGIKIAVVCHGGVINAYLAHVLGLAPGSQFFYPNYTSIHRVVASSRGHRQIVSVNESFHLRGSGLPIGLYS
ncbi:MAG TPA: histidine phosphatase family protein [Ilumatobacteraceae bacterium]|nr:histidine phosphatase family protein [Ilumatobacteraceae bacterium]